MYILLCFEAISCLKVNLGKTELVLVGEVRDLDLLAGILGLRVSSLSLKYLGFPLGENFKPRSIWNEVLEKMDKKDCQAGRKCICQNM
jgi:hypothetical protein